MRGSLVKRYKNSWSIVLDAYETDPTTGASKRKRRWITVKGTKRDAEQRLAELVQQAHRGELVEPHRLTHGAMVGALVRHGHQAPGEAPLDV